MYSELRAADPDKYPQEETRRDHQASDIAMCTDDVIGPAAIATTHDHEVSPCES